MSLLLSGIYAVCVAKKSIMLSVVMLNIVMLSVIMLSVIMLNVISAESGKKV